MGGEVTTRFLRAGPRLYATAVLLAISLIGFETIIVGGLSHLAVDSFVFAGVVLTLLVASTAG